MSVEVFAQSEEILLQIYHIGIPAQDLSTSIIIIIIEIRLSLSLQDRI